MKDRNPPELRFSPNPNSAHLVDWRPWDQAALEEAKRKDRLILLSISAVWCHWCHVMDESTYSKKEIIDIINENFIPVRVDADMRPDVDNMYNQGGWPSTVFLTPDGEIVHGGTYIPPDDMFVRLERLIELYPAKRSMIESRFSDVKRELEMMKPTNIAPSTEQLRKVLNIIEESFDWTHGGFGSSQKFPNTDAIDLLTAQYSDSGNTKFREMVSITLGKMASGDIFDHVEGGFFRYSTKRDWSIPHYEKMLADNAGIIKNYLIASAVLDEPWMTNIAERTMKYVLDNLTDLKMYRFFGSQDADESYYIKNDRKGLKVPFIDKTTYTDSNARMISTLTYSYCLNGNYEHLALAERSAFFINESMYSPSAGVKHYYTGDTGFLSGVLSDNVLHAISLLDLYNVTGNNSYLRIARGISDLLIKDFFIEDVDRFRPSLNTTGTSPLHTGTLNDYNTCLVNFRVSLLFARLHYHLNLDEYLNTANKVLSSFGDIFDAYLPAAPVYGLALRWLFGDPLIFIIVAGQEVGSNFIGQIRKIHHPEKVVRLLSPDVDRTVIEDLGLPANVNAAYICEGKRCSRPVTEPDMIEREMQAFLKS
ncbi:MAG: thioredoxin domain-containing protein [Nitrospirota bacterium]|nr:MAG: thioredoxin domain-containing protein [Nitrospirota bacterium]